MIINDEDTLAILNPEKPVRGSVQVAYLGTGSHDAELAFLVPVDAVLGSERTP